MWQTCEAPPASSTLTRKRQAPPLGKASTTGQLLGVCNKAQRSWLLTKTQSGKKNLIAAPLRSLQILNPNTQHVTLSTPSLLAL
jgi:hypothetical protein